MVGNGKKALDARGKNRDEIIHFSFVKNGKAYFFDLFFGVKSLKYLLFPLIAGILYLFAKLMDIDEDGKIFYLFLLFYLCATSFCWICRTLFGVWKWKYDKNVVVTNEGIWIMVFSNFWWNPAWDGKKHFISASWSLYEWEELEKLTVFTNRTARIFKVKNFKMKRWDGIEEVFYLKADDMSALIDLSDKLIKKRREKKDDDNFKKKLDFTEKVVQFIEKEVEE